MREVHLVEQSGDLVGRHRPGEQVALHVIATAFTQESLLCLGLDALWQLVGFFLVWSGHKGKGRALGVGKVKFSGQVLPTAKRVTFRLDIKRLITRKLVLAIADGTVEVDGREIYVAEDLRVGLFISTDDF